MRFYAVNPYRDMPFEGETRKKLQQRPDLLKPHQLQLIPRPYRFTKTACLQDDHPMTDAAHPTRDINVSSPLYGRQHAWGRSGYGAKFSIPKASLQSKEVIILDSAFANFYVLEFYYLRIIKV